MISPADYHYTNRGAVRPTAMTEDHITIETPEHIQFTYELAGLGSRFLALFVDHLILAAALLLVVGGLLSLHGVLVGLVPQLTNQLLGIPVFVIVVILSATLFYVAYFIFYEMIWAGQTPGKRLAGLRAIRTSGQRIGFIESAIRNILRFADMVPPLQAVGILSVFFTRRSQRLGDLAAGTIVVKERLAERPAAGGEEGGEPATGLGPHDELVRRAQSGVRALGRQEIETLRRFIQRRDELSAQLRSDLARDIAQSLRERFPQLAQESQQNPELFVEVVYQAYLEHGQRA